MDCAWRNWDESVSVVGETEHGAVVVEVPLEVSSLIASSVWMSMGDWLLPSHIESALVAVPTACPCPTMPVAENG